jgi:predicted O-methyltransferase YrrM
MRIVLRALKRIWFFSFLRRIFIASRYANKKYCQVLRWGFKSNEFTNYTYHLTELNMTYLTNTIALVTGKDYNTVLGYINEALHDEVLNNYISEETQKSPFGRWADKEVRFGRRLGWYAFARIIKPKVIVETGVDKGLGSVLLCAALLRNREEGYEGKFYGTDINPEAGYLLSGKYKEVGEILYGDSIESLKKFPYKIDLFINDSDHSKEYEYQEYITIKDLLTDNSVVLGDNSHITDKLVKFSRETGRNFVFFGEKPKDHWYPGAGIGISYKNIKAY